MKKGKRAVFYIIGSIAMATSAVFIMPKVVDYLSEKIYQPSTSETDDDWGPEIVRKETAVEDITSEEDTDGEL